ncbi:neprilysin-like [Prorops nasuta]|uniref:neprilysin-like n=1 Tax=Prorops nasuta TaxID=863751 RepID=UPI0034CDF704
MSVLTMDSIMKIICWLLICYSVTTVLGRRLPKSPKDNKIFNDSNLLDVPWYKTLIRALKHEEESQSSLTCQTEECARLGRFFHVNMNKNVNPCDDFYEYACGNWSNNSQIPKDRTRWDVLDQSAADVQSKIRKILEEEVKPEDILPLTLAKNWYKACMDEETMNARGLSPVVSLVTSNRGWPLIMQEDHWESVINRWTNIESYYIDNFGKSSFFTYGAVGKGLEKHNPKPFLRIAPPDLPLMSSTEQTDRSQFYSSDSYKKLIKAVANKIANETGTTLNEEKLAKDVDDLINFEKKLYEIIQNNNPEEMSSTNETFSEDDNSDTMKNFHYGSIFDEDDEDDEELKIVDKEGIITKRISKKRSTMNNHQINNKWKKGTNQRIQKNHTKKQMNKDSKKRRDRSQQNLKENESMLLSRLRISKRRHGKNNYNKEQKSKIKEQIREDAVNGKTSEHNDEEIDEWLNQVFLRSQRRNSKNTKVARTKKDIKTKQHVQGKNKHDMDDGYVRNNNAFNKDHVKNQRNAYFNDQNNYNDSDISDKINKGELEPFKSQIQQVLLNLREFFEEVVKEYLAKLFSEVPISTTDVPIDLQMSRNYLKQFLFLLLETPQEVIANYIQWSFVSEMLKYTTNDMRRMIFRFQNGHDDISEQEERWKTCIEEVEMSDIIYYEYVNKYFPREHLEAGYSMVDSLKTGAILDIEESTWFNNDMKMDAMVKVDKMKEFVGYPKWYSNNTAVENRYRGLNIGSQHFDNALSYQKYQALQNLKPLLKVEMEDFIWTGSLTPISLNAMYLPEFNSLIVPAGLFSYPFFSIWHPDALRYGLLGSLIIHEISHGFDSISRNYDKDGKEFTWDEQMDKEYISRAKCFVKQYGSYSFRNGNFISQLDGNITLDENIADSTGIHSLYKVFKLARALKGTPDPKIPGLEDFSEDQLFFLSAASVWCETIKPPKNKKVSFKNVTHSPGQIRVLGELSNSEEFSKAFSCPVGSKMNPEKKCYIWK